MPLLRSLLNAGVLANDAQVLEAAFANEPEQEFLAGLEQVARALAGGNVILVPPAGEPWCSIHVIMVQSGLAPDVAFSQALGAWPTNVQAAISGAVSVRMQDLQQWAAQQQQQGRRRKTAEYIQALAHLGYSFRYNLCTNNIEVNGKPLSDLLMMEIRGRLRDFGIFDINIAEDAYQAEAGRNRYHPVKDYLHSLKFAGGDPIAELAGYFDDVRNVFATWLRRWLIGACARVMASEQNRMLVLDGVQNLGKDHFACWLASPLPEYYREGPILPDEKDHRLRLMSTWVWDVNELGSTTRRSDREALKAFLTTQTVQERKAYGHFDIQGPAMASFIGTVNNESGILTDPTGSRRFMVAQLRKIDWTYTQLDIDQIWAQAFELYLAGEPWQLQGDEADLATQINEEYQTVDLVEETLRKHFVIEPGNAGIWMGTIDIMEVLKDPVQGNLKPGTEIDARRLASALTKMGLEKPLSRKLGSKVQRGYYGIRRGP